MNYTQEDWVVSAQEKMVKHYEEMARVDKTSCAMVQLRAYYHSSLRGIQGHRIEGTLSSRTPRYQRLFSDIIIHDRNTTTSPHSFHFRPNFR
jgi:hypothetical protein